MDGRFLQNKNKNVGLKNLTYSLRLGNLFGVAIFIKAHKGLNFFLCDLK